MVAGEMIRVSRLDVPDQGLDFLKFLRWSMLAGWGFPAIC